MSKLTEEQIKAIEYAILDVNTLAHEDLDVLQMAELKSAAKETLKDLKLAFPDIYEYLPVEMSDE